MILRTTNGDIELHQDAEVRLSYIYPAPEEKRLQSEYTWWFDIPDTPRNRALLQFPASGNITSIDVIADFSILQRKATLIVRNVYRHNYRAMLNFLGINQHIGKKLAELIGSDIVHLGDDAAEISATAETLLSNTTPSQKITFPRIQAPNFISDAEYVLYPVINYWNMILQQFLINTVDNPREHNMVPQPFLSYILKRCLNNVGYQYAGEFSEASWADQLLIVSNFNADRYTQDGYVKISGTYFEISVQAQLNTFTTVVEDPANEWNGTTQEIEATEGGSYMWKFTAEKADIPGVPDAYNEIGVNIYINGTSVSGAVQGVSDFNVPFSLEGDFDTSLTNFSVYVMVVFFEQTPGVVVKQGAIQNFTLELIPVSRMNVNRWATDIDVSNLVPDVTLAELLHGIAMKFSLAVFFDEQRKQVVLNFMDTYFSDKTVLDITPFALSETQEYVHDYIDFTYAYNMPFEVKGIEGKIYQGSYPTFAELPIPSNISHYAFISSLNLFAVVEQYEDETLVKRFRWIIGTDNYFSTGTGNTEISADIETLQMREQLYETVHQCISPYSEELSSRSINRSGEEAPRQSPVLIYYIGMEENNDALLYPYASSSPTTPQGVAVPGYYLSWQCPQPNNIGKLGERYYERAKGRLLKISISPAHVYDVLELFRASSKYNFVRYMGRQFRPVTLDIVINGNGVREIQLQVR